MPALEGRWKSGVAARTGGIERKENPEGGGTTSGPESSEAPVQACLPEPFGDGGGTVAGTMMAPTAGSELEPACAGFVITISTPFDLA